MAKKDPQKSFFVKRFARADFFLRPILFYRFLIIKIFSFLILLAFFAFTASVFMGLFSFTGPGSYRPAAQARMSKDHCVHDLCALGLEKDPYARLQRRFKKDIAFMGPSLALGSVSEKSDVCFWNHVRKKVLIIPQNQSLPLDEIIDLDDKIRTHLPSGLLIHVGLLDEKNVHVVLEGKNAEDKKEELSKWEMTASWQDGVDPAFSEKLLHKADIAWYGEDLFLKYHASSTDQQLQRLDFLGSKPKSFYLNRDRFLKYSDSKEWQLLTKDSIDTQKPIRLFLQDFSYIELGEVFDEGAKLSLYLWPEGSYRKIEVVLDKKREDSGTKTPWDIEQIQKRIQFRGVHAKQTALVQLDRTPMQLKPQDWFILKQQGGWQKLTSVQMVDDYVHGRLRGSLFMVMGIDSQEQQKHLHLRVFSPGRTMMKEFSVVLAVDRVKPTLAPVNPGDESVASEERETEKSSSQVKSGVAGESSGSDSSSDEDDDFFYWKPEYEELDEDDVFEEDAAFDNLQDLLRDGAGKLTPEELLKMLKTGHKKQDQQEP